MKRNLAAIEREHQRKARLNGKNQRITGITLKARQRITGNIAPSDVSDIKFAVPREVIASTMRNRTKGERNQVKRSLRSLHGTTPAFAVDHEPVARKSLTSKEFKTVLIDWMRDAPLIVSARSTL